MSTGTTPVPPAPAPGQRWLDTYGTYSHIDILGVSDGGLYFTITPGEGCGIAAFSLGRFRYLGPTPGPTTSPAHPPTAVPLPPPSPGRAAVGAGGPPAEYEPCPKGCGRWKHRYHVHCWQCFFSGNAEAEQYYGPLGSQQCPDWTPRSGAAIQKGDAVALLPDGTIVKAGGRRDSATARPAHPAGINCKRCLTTSEKGDAHREACPVMRERGPSAVAMAAGRARDTFADLADDWDLLPEAGR